MKSPPTNPRVEITWLGHSAFKLVSSTRKIILIDPWLENPKAPAGLKDSINADIILVTHGHSDHIGNTIEIAKRTNAKVIAIYEVSVYLQSAGLSNVQGMSKGGTVKVDGIEVSMVDARHSSTIEVDGKMIHGGEAAGFVVRLENGYRIYHAGDTALFMDMKLIGQLHRPHVAIVPVGDLYTMGPRDAAIACKWIKPKHIIGMHYGTFPALTGTLDELRYHLPMPLKSR
ncbi:MAG: beta-lactamase, partial [Bacteroidetes bacterium]|nr:beta-lactamase [Bacteroidota bacterium]